MRKIYDGIIGLLVFFSAMFYLSGRNFHEAQNDLFHLAVPAVIALMFCLNPLRNIKNYWLNVFVIFCTITILFAKVNRAIMIEPMVNIMLVLGLFYAIVNYVEDRKPIYQAMFLVMILNFAMIVLQYFRMDPLCRDDLGAMNIRHLVGFFGHPMNLGIYSALMLPVFANRYKRWLWVPFICLLASKSFFAIPIGLIALLAYYIITKQKSKIIITSIMCLAGAITLLNLSAGRWEWVWKTKVMLRFDVYMEMLKAGLSSGSPIGYGLGTFRQVANQLVIKNHGTIGTILEPWNEYIGWLIELGPIAVGLVVGLFWGVLKTLKSIKHDGEAVSLYCALATIPIGICFHSYTYFVNTGVISLVILSLFYITKEEADVN